MDLRANYIAMATFDNWLHNFFSFNVMQIQMFEIFLKIEFNQKVLEIGLTCF